MHEGHYYLHTNGELIHKLHADVGDFRESDFVRAFWPVDTSDREGAWSLLVEALAAGAKTERVLELAKKWGCTSSDANIYAQRVGARLMMEGRAFMAVRADFVNLQESPAGFGTSALEALAELAKTLGYQPTKMWGATFKQLLTSKEKAHG